MVHCPYCKSLIRNNALICKKCQSDFRTPQGAADFKAQVWADSKHNLGCLLVLVVPFVFVVLIGMTKACS